MAQCKALVVKRDDYPWYHAHRCQRSAQDNGYCWQHQKQAQKEGNDA